MTCPTFHLTHPPTLSSLWSQPPVSSGWHQGVLATHLQGICHTILHNLNLHKICNTSLFTTDPSKAHGTIIAHANLGQICHRAFSFTDLSDLYCSSHDWPDPLIPVLPVMGLDAQEAGEAPDP